MGFLMLFIVLFGPYETHGQLSVRVEEFWLGALLIYMVLYVGLNFRDLPKLSHFKKLDAYYL